MSLSTANNDHPALRLVEAGETVQALADANEVSLLVTDRRVAVASSDRVALNIGFDALRRIQFDIERERPATLVIVPDDPLHEPQVIPIDPAQFDDITRALAVIGRRLASLSS
jgi:hypothetical protein